MELGLDLVLERVNLDLGNANRITTTTKTTLLPENTKITPPHMYTPLPIPCPQKRKHRRTLFNALILLLMKCIS